MIILIEIGGNDQCEGGGNQLVLRDKLAVIQQFLKVVVLGFIKLPADDTLLVLNTDPAVINA